MSREERKMAHIIASIERMEQSPKINAGTSSNNSRKLTEPQDHTVNKHTGENSPNKLGSKMIRIESGKRLKPLSSKQKLPSNSSNSSLTKRKSNITVSIGQTTTCESRLTPKQRWIQQWKDELACMHQNSPDLSIPTDNSIANKAENAPLLKDDTVSPTIQENIEAKEPEIVSTAQDHQSIADKADVEMIEENNPIPLDQTITKDVETEPKASSTVSNNVEPPISSTHRSPSIEVPMPIVTESISPSSKDKDLANVSSASVPPMKYRQESAEYSDRESFSSSRSSEDQRRKKSSEPKEDETSETPKNEHEIDENMRDMTPEERRRAIRRSKRKSNWDVTTATSPHASYLNAGQNGIVNNHASGGPFSKFPRNSSRPYWSGRGNIDPTGNGPSSHYDRPHDPSLSHSRYPNHSYSNPGSRRPPFKHSQSLPFDTPRSRSGGRYHHPPGSGGPFGNNFR